MTERLPHGVRSPAPCASLSWPWLAAATVAFASNLFLHLPMTDVFDGWAAHLGFRRYDRLLTGMFALLAMATLIVVGMRRNRRPLLLLTTAVLIGLAGLAHALLVVASVEHIHYPQYALLAFLLGRGGTTAEGSWVGATALGAADEGYQHLVLRRGTPEYFDWNDVVLNAVGAAFGIVALLISRNMRNERPLCTRLTMAAILGVSLPLVFLAAPQARAPFWQPTAVGGHYHVLSAGEGLATVAALWLGVRHVLARNRLRQTA